MVVIPFNLPEKVGEVIDAIYSMQSGNDYFLKSLCRYHDGHVKCDKDGEKWHGFLLAVYDHDHGCIKAQHFRRLQRACPETVTIISNTDNDGSNLPGTR